MNVKELIEKWKKRREEILNTLPDILHTEYDELGIAIRKTRSVLPKPENNGTTAQPEESQEKEGGAEKKRVSLLDRKKQLIKYLKDSGPTTRGKILTDTEIPNGSLGIILKSHEFIRTEDGLWDLSEEEK